MNYNGSLIILLGLLLFGCNSAETEFVYLPHYRMIQANTLHVPRATAYEYVLIKNPPEADTALMHGMMNYADSLDRATNKKGQYNLEIGFYEWTADTRVFEHNKRDPNELARMTLDNHMQHFLGSYSISRCAGDTQRKVVKLVLVDSTNENSVLGKRNFTLMDECSTSVR